MKDETMTLFNKRTGEKLVVNISQHVRDWHADAPGIGLRIGQLPFPALKAVLARLGYSDNHQSILGIQ